MKHKTFFVIVLTTILCLSFLVPSAWAKRHRCWEGAAIFLGTAFLLDAFIHSARPCYAPKHYCCPPLRRTVVHTRRYPRHRRIWVPSTTERVWHGGYHDGYGRRSPGYWKIIKRPGHWRQKTLGYLEVRPTHRLKLLTVAPIAAESR